MSLNINFDHVAESIMKVLDRYDIPYDRHVIHNTTVPTWFERKRNLLELFSKHPQWDNDSLSVVFTTNYKRDIDGGRARYAACNLLGAWASDNYDSTPETQEAYNRLHYSLHIYELYESSKITHDNQLFWLEHLCPTDKDPKRFFPVGLRTSRAFDRLFKYYHIDEWSGYNKCFAQLADLTNPMSIDRTTALSFHPCDYLLMSNGTGWESCHNLGDGGWKGGTWSYMFDRLSSILYTTEQTVGPLWNREKVNRMVCCFDGPEILFSRLYPNEFDRDLRSTIRNVVQEMYCQCSGFANLWQAPVHAAKTGWCCNGEGHMNYEDYTVHDWLTELSVLKGHEPHYMYIGTYGICPETGEEYQDHHEMTSIGGCECAHCGRRIRRSEGHEFDWDTYCDRCWDDLFAECACCGETEYRDNMMDSEDGLICQECAENDYSYCESCDAYYRPENGVLDVNGEFYCNDCAAQYLTRCDGCGEYFNDGDVTAYGDHMFCPDCLEAMKKIEAAREAMANA